MQPLPIGVAPTWGHATPTHWCGSDLGPGFTLTLTLTSTPTQLLHGRTSESILKDDFPCPDGMLMNKASLQCPEGEKPYRDKYKGSLQCPEGETFE